MQIYSNQGNANKIIWRNHCIYHQPFFFLFLLKATAAIASGYKEYFYTVHLLMKI